MRAITLWGIIGVSALLTQAVVRLTPHAIAPFLDSEIGLTPWHLGLYLVWAAFNLYVEGYRTFHLRWCPRVVSRAYHLGRHPKPLSVLLAPLYCMSFFGASRRGMIVSWVLLTMIVSIIIAVRQAPQPYRGIVDGGVIVPLAWGVVGLWINAIRWWDGSAPTPSDLPASEALSMTD